MENINEKSSGKLSAQEMIKANTAAEAAHREQIEKQNKQYEEELEVLRQNAQALENRLGEIEGNIGTLVEKNKEIDSIIQGLGSNITDLKNELGDRLDKSDEATHDVGVRIYRNVQAAVIEEQKKQLDEIRENTGKQMESIRGEFTMLVRQLDSIQRAGRAKNRGLVPLSVIILLVSIANLVLLILRIIGLV